MPSSFKTESISIVTSASNGRPLFLSKVRAGFPSPADDYIEKILKLDDYLIKHPATTFFIRAQGDSMINAGIFDNDILIVDKCLAPFSNKIVIAIINGEFTVKRYVKKDQRLWLMPENPHYSPIEIKDNSVELWGVVTAVIHFV